MKLLSIESSPNADRSASRAVSRYLIEKIRRSRGATTVLKRDLALRPLPHITGSTVQAYFTPAESRTAEQSKSIQLSEDLVDELLSVDALVIATPMWNFGIPSVLKAWIDHVVRAGRTFSYSADGLKGLVTGKKVYLVVSSGSVFSEGPYVAADLAIPSMKAALGFIGMTDIEVIRVEGTNDPSKAQMAVANAKAHIDQII